MIALIGWTGWRKLHRTVVLPDFQGIGVGGALSDAVCQHLFDKDGIRVRTVMSAPGLIAYRKNSKRWRCVSAPKHQSPDRKGGIQWNSQSSLRLTATFVFVPDQLQNAAQQLGKKMPARRRSETPAAKLLRAQRHRGQSHRKAK